MRSLSMRLGLLGIAMLFQGALSAGEASPRAEMAFVFTRQTGPGTNQFAVWIEDADGKFVKTVYATRFTATGGYAKRPDALKEWVKTSDRANLADKDVDAVTGATPATGPLVYAWDGTDAAGKPAPAGKYVMVLEATLRGPKSVVYRAPFAWGGAEVTNKPKPVYSVEDVAEKAMIADVAFRYGPTKG